MDLIVRIKSILLEELNLEYMPDDAHQEDFPEWDSITYLRIIGALEEKFGINITPENIDRFNSIPSIAEEIRNATDHR